MITEEHSSRQFIHCNGIIGSNTSAMTNACAKMSHLVTLQLIGLVEVIGAGDLSGSSEDLIHDTA
jgi:hypothetical protein